MSVKSLYQELIRKSTLEEYQTVFSKARNDIKIALFQKLLYQAGENKPEAKKALESILSIKESTFYDSLEPELKKLMAIEQQRYNVAKANALYQDFLYQKALENAALTPDNLLFDPQGRLVYQLTLNEQQQNEVLQNIETSLGIQQANTARNYNEIKSRLKDLLGGRTPTDTTLCSIDLSGQEPPTKNSNAYTTIRTAYKNRYGDINNIPDHKRTSIVASFEETYAHMILMANTYEYRSRNFDPEGIGVRINPQAWKSIHQNAAFTIQDKAAEIYKEAIKKATKNGEIDTKKVNAVLGEKRKFLADFAKETIIKEMIKQLKAPPQNYNREQILGYMQNLCQRLDKHHTFTEHTATGFDYFYTSDYLQQGMLITKTKDTAHGKPSFKENGEEDQAAFRRVTYTYRDKEGNLLPTNKVSARIPSPALVFNEHMSDEDIRKDLHGKYGFLHNEMRAMRGGKHGPVVENLFTSFHGNLFESIPPESTNNRQRTTALRMMEAMHEFNAKQFKNNAENNDFLYVQNIGTNRHTVALGYRVDRDLGGSVELDDITLSAEIAMLYSLQENSAYLSDKVKDQLDNINKEVLIHYKAFLDRDPRETYFAESDEGLSLIKNIRDFKQSLSNQLKNEELDADDLPSLTSNALAKMLASNQHWDPRYGQLAQALSMYAEWASTGGCKSGNERNQDVMARFALLTSIHERVEHDGNMNYLQEHEKEIYRQLHAYAKGETPDPDQLRAAISVSVAECNMHGGVSHISREDQGGAAKINSFSFLQNIKNPYIYWAANITIAVVGTLFGIAAALTLIGIPIAKKIFNELQSNLIDTNNAADREMNLNSASASKTQAHKNQDKRTREVIKEVLNDDPLFKDNPLTKQEIAGFKENKELTTAAHEPHQKNPLHTKSSSSNISIQLANNNSDRAKEELLLAIAHEKQRQEEKKERFSNTPSPAIEIPSVIQEAEQQQQENNTLVV